MTFSRSWLLATAVLAPALLVQPARAAQTAHHGLAFAVRQGAKARLVEPDGRVLSIDGASDMVAPAAIASQAAQNAIAKLVRTPAPAKGTPWPVIDIDATRGHGRRPQTIPPNLGHGPASGAAAGQGGSGAAPARYDRPTV